MLALSAGLTTVAAWIGLWTWKRELAGKEQFHAARSLLKCSHRLWRACAELSKEVRSAELQKVVIEFEDGLSEREKTVIAAADVYLRRAAEARREWEEYKEARLEAGVVMGVWVYEVFLPFDEKVGEALDQAAERLGVGSVEDRVSLLLSRIDKSENCMSHDLAVDDEISKELRKTWVAAEKQLREALGRSKHS